MRKLLFSILLLSISCFAVQAQKGSKAKSADKILNKYRQQAIKQRFNARTSIEKFQRLQSMQARKQRQLFDRNPQRRLLERRNMMNQKIRSLKPAQIETLRLFRLYRSGKLS